MEDAGRHTRAYENQTPRPRPPSAPRALPPPTALPGRHGYSSHGCGHAGLYSPLIECSPQPGNTLLEPCAKNCDTSTMVRPLHRHLPREVPAQACAPTSASRSRHLQFKALQTTSRAYSSSKHHHARVMGGTGDSTTGKPQLKSHLGCICAAIPEYGCLDAPRTALMTTCRHSAHSTCPVGGRFCYGMWSRGGYRGEEGEVHRPDSRPSLHRRRAGRAGCPHTHSGPNTARYHCARTTWLWPIPSSTWPMRCSRSLTGL